MFEIEFADLKGDYIHMIFTRTWKQSEKGLWEQWVYVDQDWNPKFAVLPIPCFSEWWDANYAVAAGDMNETD